MELFVLTEKDADGDLIGEVFTTRDKAKEFGNRLKPVDENIDEESAEWSDRGIYSFRTVDDTVQEIKSVTLDPPMREY